MKMMMKSIANKRKLIVATLSVGIQTAALLVTHYISYGHPARNKHAGYLFEFHLPITLAVI